MFYFAFVLLLSYLPRARRTHVAKKRAKQTQCTLHTPFVAWQYTKPPSICCSRYSETFKCSHHGSAICYRTQSSRVSPKNINENQTCSDNNPLTRCRC